MTNGTAPVNLRVELGELADTSDSPSPAGETSDICRVLKELRPLPRSRFALMLRRKRAMNGTGNGP